VLRHAAKALEEIQPFAGIGSAAFYGIGSLASELRARANGLADTVAEVRGRCADGHRMGCACSVIDRIEGAVEVTGGDQ
jgi:hypothetical protein